MAAQRTVVSDILSCILNFEMVHTVRNHLRELAFREDVAKGEVHN